MESLLLTEQARTHLQALLNDAPHALLIIGPSGYGKHTIAKSWASNLTSADNISIVEPDEKGTISIETVRGLYRLTRSKHDARQVVIVTEAQTMGIEAQNAFLKLLEEPNQAVSFILTAPTSEALLPTITSRTQIISLARLSNQILQAYAKKHAPHLSEQELNQLLFVADGRPGTLAYLIEHTEAFDEHRRIMQQAKKLLSATTYERLSSITELIKDKPQMIATLEAMAHMLYLQIMREPQPRLIKLANNLERCLVRLAQNGNPRAQLTALFSS